MIVFTATNQATREIYVGSARDSMEEHWARLIVLAEEGGSGEFLEMIREYGADQISIEMWAYADSSAESREMVREACEETGAKLIKTGRAPAPAASDLVDSRSESKTTKSASTSGNVSPINAQVSAKLAAAKLAEEAKKEEATRARREAQKNHGPITKVDVSAYLADQQAQLDKAAAEADVVSLRKTESTKVAEDMKAVMMRIEMKRKQNRGTGTTTAKPRSRTKAATSKTASSSPVGLSKAPKKDRLPQGRVSSSTKEKKIKEAIAQERMERESIQASKAAAEAKEMAEIMARLDVRSKEKAKIHRRR